MGNFESLPNLDHCDFIITTQNPEIAQQYHLDCKIITSDENVTYTAKTFLSGLSKCQDFSDEFTFAHIDSVELPKYLQAIIRISLGMSCNVPSDLSTLRSWMRQAIENGVEIFSKFSLDVLKKSEYSPELYNFVSEFKLRFQKHYNPIHDLVGAYIETCNRLDDEFDEKSFGYSDNIDEKICYPKIPKYSEDPEFWDILIQKLENEDPEFAWEICFSLIEPDEFYFVFGKYYPTFGDFTEKSCKDIFLEAHGVNKDEDKDKDEDEDFDQEAESLVIATKLLADLLKSL